MKAAVYEGIRDLQVQTRPDPTTPSNPSRWPSMPWGSSIRL